MARYRVPPRASRSAGPTRPHRALDDAGSRTRAQDQAQQLPVQVPEPLLPQIRRPAPAPRPDSGDHDQVELDLGLDTGIGAEAPADPFGEQLTIDIADGPPIRERAHGVTGDHDLAAQTAAAEADLHRDKAAADDWDQATALLLAALLDGRGDAVTTLRRRRLRLATVAAMAARTNQLLDQAHEDRTEATRVRKRVDRLRKLAGTLRMSKAGKLEDSARTRARAKATGPGWAVSRREALRYANILEDSAVDLEPSAESNQAEAPQLRRRAEQLAATEHETVEAAELAEHFTDQQLQDQDAAAVAGDTASTEQQRQPGAVRNHAAARRGARRNGGAARGAGAAGAAASRSARPGGGDLCRGAVQGTRGEEGRCGQAHGVASPAGAWAARPEPRRRGALNRSVRTVTSRTAPLMRTGGAGTSDMPR